MRIVDLDSEKVYRDYKKRFYKHSRLKYPWYITLLLGCGIVLFVILLLFSLTFSLRWYYAAWLADVSVFVIDIFLAYTFLKSHKEPLEKKRKSQLRWKCVLLKAYLHRKGLLKVPYIHHLENFCDDETKKPSLLSRAATGITVIGPLISIAINELTEMIEKKQVMGFLNASLILSVLAIAFMPAISLLVNTLPNRRRNICADLKETLAIVEANM